MTRRRALRLFAAAAGCALLPASSARRGAMIHEWSGTALGAPARITLHHPDAAAARALITACVQEIERLEAEFSLFRRDSALVRLNRDGELVRPGQDLRRLLAEAVRFGDLSAGRFDVTVQPLWHLLADHGAAGTTPAPTALAAARALVDYRRITIAPERIRFGVPGMAVTLNGIAQGYITDRVADLLRAHGIAHVLLDLGEIRGLGPKPDGSPWRIGVRAPAEPGRMLHTLDLTDQAVATSAEPVFQPGTLPGGHHILDPITGRPAAFHAGITVVAGTATTADALSTALFLTPPEELPALAARGGALAVLVAEPAG